MNENQRAILATLVGAAIGGIAGYLFFTEQGRRARHAMEPALDNLAHELSQFRTTMQKAADVASEGWKLLNETFGEGARPGGRYPTPHQTSPF